MTLNALSMFSNRLNCPEPTSNPRPHRLIMACFHRLAFYKQIYRRWLLGQMGIQYGENCTIGDYTDFKLGLRQGQWGSLELGNQVILSQGVILHSYGGSIAIADDVSLGPNTTIYGHGGVTIGKNTLIAMNCSILSSNHTIPSEHDYIRDHPDILHPTVIEEDVWLGAGVIVLGGVTIGKGSVVGAGAVVSHSLPPYSIAVGVPAKVIRRRS